MDPCDDTGYEDTGYDDTGLEITQLSDALGIGLEMLELFGDVDVCAAWLGTADGRMCDYVVCTEDRGRDVGLLVSYVAAVADAVGADSAVLWRATDGLADVTALASAFFDHVETLEQAGVHLLDEIVFERELLRSMAVTSFTDGDGWDDVTSRLSSCSTRPRGRRVRGRSRGR